MSKIIQNFKNISYGPAPEDSKDVISWINSLNNPNHLFINGVWVKSKSSKKLQVINPASNKKLTTLSISNKTDVNAAVGAAKKAFNSWSKTSSDTRAKYLYALARLIQKHSRFLSVLETIDNGKPIRETRDIDIPLVARHFYQITGKKVGFKPAGGISTAKTVIEFLILVMEELGHEWINPKYLRIGASSLLIDIERQLYHFALGRYANKEKLAIG